MKKCRIFTVNSSSLNDLPFMSKMINKEIDKRINRKRAKNFKIGFHQNGEDFIHNQTTVRIEYNY